MMCETFTVTSIKGKWEESSMRKWFSLAALAVFMLVSFHPNPVFAQGTEDIQTLKKDVESLKAGQKTIEKEIQDLKRMLQARQAPSAPPPFRETEIDIDHAPMKGAKSAKLVLIEFSDYQ
jgi:hypothetical protein